MQSPNPLRVGFAIWRQLRSVRPPDPVGKGGFDHSGLLIPLSALTNGGLPGLATVRGELTAYLAAAGELAPDDLSRDEALAYWINLYNAGAMQLSAEAFVTGEASVLRVPGAFDRPLVSVSGELMSLNGIEHAKVRRFRDPRVHGALVCGSLSCPTLRGSPFKGETVESDLDDQMVQFLSKGGAVVDDQGVLRLSKIFQWYGRDFVSPSKMPTFLPVSRKQVVRSLGRWLREEALAAQAVEYQDYDWGLACSVA